MARAASAPHFLKRALLLITIIIGQLILPAQDVRAEAGADAAPPPPLPAFVASISGTDPFALRGVYADGHFALSVIQQPSKESGYVSRKPDSVTQFQLATLQGSIGLLAHNYLSGRFFSELQPGQTIELVYGNGNVKRFRVTAVLRYQALSPRDPRSSFVDLATHERMSAAQLFEKVYGIPGRLTLQTCISRDGDVNWGRLFVLAVPDEASPPWGWHD